MNKKGMEALTGIIIVVLMTITIFGVIRGITGNSTTALESIASSSTCDFDKDGKLGSDICPCDAPDPRRGNGYVQFKDSDSLMRDDAQAAFWNTFKFDKREEFLAGRTLTERDAEALTEYVQARSTEAKATSSVNVKWTLTTLTNYIDETKKGLQPEPDTLCGLSQGTIEDRWKRCTPAAMNEHLFLERVDDDKKAEYVLTCFTPDELCKEKLQESCFS